MGSIGGRQGAHHKDRVEERSQILRKALSRFRFTIQEERKRPWKATGQGIFAQTVGSLLSNMMAISTSTAPSVGSALEPEGCAPDSWIPAGAVPSPEITGAKAEVCFAFCSA